MFFLLSKVLVFIIQPIIWMAALGIYGLCTKNEKRKKRALIASLLLLLFFTNPLIHDIAFYSWEYRPIAMAELEEHDVAIVLGGYSNPLANPRDRLHLGKNPNRLVNAVQLYKAGKVKKLLLTGGSAAIIGEKVSESGTVASFIDDFGIPAEDILVESNSRNTSENASHSLEVLREAGLEDARCLLITSAFHMPRAVRCFQKRNFPVTPFATDRYVTRWRPNLIKYLTPSSGELDEWHLLIKEWVGMAAYKARGYI